MDAAKQGFSDCIRTTSSASRQLVVQAARRQHALPRARRSRHTPVISCLPDPCDPGERGVCSRPSRSVTQVSAPMSLPSYKLGHRSEAYAREPAGERAASSSHGSVPSGGDGNVMRARSSWGQFCPLDESRKGAAVARLTGLIRSALRPVQLGGSLTSPPGVSISSPGRHHGTSVGRANQLPRDRRYSRIADLALGIRGHAAMTPRHQTFESLRKRI